MEFTISGRLEVRITPADVGKRVSVRQVLEGGREGAGFTDTVGVLTSWTGGVLSVTTKSGQSVHIPEPALVAGKTVPAAPARRRGPAASFEELTRVTARAWQPVEEEALGGWRLRAAAGFTRRANSVLPLGDPGLPLEAALERVGRWYAQRGLPAYVQAGTGAEGAQEGLCAGLEEHGWRREVSAEVRIAALAPLGDLEADASRVRLARAADDAWLSRYQRFSTLGRAPGAPVLKVLGSGPSVWFASVPGDGPDAVPAAIGRAVVDGRWAGFMAVEVGPEHRRRGLGTAVMTALARRALDEGASAAWLQVETDNGAARALYDGMGFATHHLYHHFRAAEGVFRK
ncbi:GNAT family N-acetyltransferase [Streptomyces nitrosporeus]|uniref:GNAT family N-acetyltransferase n=1 Tax=Streptomyces nitrosporeus TaxID=28894 RepID=A0A5J6F8G7_9ACTN|nr:GNAT family N-acetyltransferase [Streptomyces nitrosporeus]QEU72512.1 GNAT family N-acetyltransferase [Streptomyces nitrosporeus]GGY77335.1 N-acetyltransferase [Streptomyces nitrosporeus]